MKKVVVGMSGGVDSSVAAYLLKEEGYDVIGVTMLACPESKNKGDEIGDANDAARDARRVAELLDIPYYVIDFRGEFRTNVMDYFASEYYKGRTPNPCIVCNRYVKWEALLKQAEDVGADFVATGHYARVMRLPNGRFSLKRAAVQAKDQTYALYRLTQEQLSRTQMPVGAYSKDEIRRIALGLGMDVAGKPDSQEICFIPDNDYGNFIQNYTGKQSMPGNFVDIDGNILGKHRGIIHYTVGQRKGLGLSLGRPGFVTKIRPEAGEVVIGYGNDVFSDELVAADVKYMGTESFSEGQRVIAKIRYGHKGGSARLFNAGKDSIRCVFDEPQRAITPGQAVVFYDDDVVLGGGSIV